MIECLKRTSRFISLWALVSLLPAATLAQDRVLVGAYDVAHFNGLVFIANEENFFGLRFLVYRQGESLEDAPSTQHIAELGPQAPDGSYARIRWQSHLKGQGVITLRWSRINQRVVIGRLTVPAGLRVALEVYRPWDHTRNERRWVNFIVQGDKRTILGETLHHKNPKPALRRFLVRTDREAAGAASYNDPTEMRQLLVKNGHAYPISTHYIAGYGLSSHSMLSFEMAENPALGFVAMVGDEVEAMGREADALLEKSLPELLDQAEKQYEARRVVSNGFIGEAVEAINRALHWNLLYIPERRIEYIAAARDRLRGPWQLVSHWDSFFLSLMMALTDPQRASSSIRAILEAQSPDGRIPSSYGLQDRPQNEAPLLAGRSMPPIGALVTWKVYLATQDLELLVASYPHLKQWNEWWFANRGDGQAWRDGNGDGLLEWGYDAELEYGEPGARALPNAAKALNAYYETGLDDSPQWSGETRLQDESGQNQPPNRVKYNEKTHTLELTPVGLNALYALDAEILMLMARELGLNADAAEFEARAQRIKQLINEKLWSEEDGLYLNRYWDGRFSRRLTPEIFYPLLAGIPDEARARRIVSRLLDTKKFWGEYVLPSVARDDPAFLEQRYWRGRIWSPMNYLVYAGLKRYGFNAEAAELARKTTALARAAWERDGRLYESYSGVNGRGGYGQGDSSVASFGGLMHLLGIEEVFSADPWSGLTIGSPTATDEARLERVRFGTDSYDVIAGPEKTCVRRNGQLEIEFAGAVRLRTYRANERAITFTIETASEVRGRVPAVEARSLAVMIDEKMAVRSAPGEEAIFKVKAGVHRLIILK